MKIHFVSHLPEGGKGFYCHYNYVQSQDPSWVYCDARPYVHPHQDQWLDDLGRWHASICQIAAQATPFWWLTPLSRVIAFQPIIFHDILFARGIVEMCRSSDFTTLTLVGFPRRIKKYIQDFNPALICEEDEAISSKLERQPSFVKKIKSKLSPIFFLLGKIVQNTFPRRHFKKSKILILSLYLNSNHFEQRGDHFFHDLFTDLPGFASEDLHWFYLPHSRNYNDEKSFKKILKQKKITGSTIYDWITLTDALFLLRQLPSIKKKLKNVIGHLPRLSLGGLESQNLTNDFGHELSENNSPAVELLIYRATQRILKQTVPQSVVYPYEGKGLERALLKACDESRYSLHRIAYAHAIYNPGLLYMRFHHESLAKPLIPDTIACTGPRQLHWLSTWCGISPERIAIIGSSRHSTPIPIKRDESQRRKSLRILMVAGLSHEVEQMANLIHQNQEVFDHCHLTIRKYPYSWLQKQEKTLVKLKAYYPELESPDLPLLAQLADCDAVLISSTSTAIEAMLSHRPVIYMDLHGIINLNPFQHKGEIPVIKQCRTAKDLKEALNTFRNMEQKEYENVVHEQANLAVEFFAAPLRNEIGKLLSCIPLARAI